MGFVRELRGKEFSKYLIRIGLKPTRKEKCCLAGLARKILCRASCAGAAGEKAAKS